MAFEDTDHDRLTTIVEKLDAMPEKITAAVALGVQPLCETLAAHEQRISAAEQSHQVLEKRLWAVALVLLTALVGVAVKVLWS